MIDLSFCCQSLRGNHAPLLGPPIPEDAPRHDDYVSVTEIEFGAEAHPSAEARDARLGPVSEEVEYVRLSAEEVAAVQFPLGRMAIGPALNEKGFSELASAVLAAAIDDDGGDISELRLSVVIARTGYMVRPGGPSGLPEVSWWPLFKPHDPENDWQLERATASWLQGFVAGHFSRRED